MSTIKTDTITALSTDGDLSLDGIGTGGVSIASTLKMTKGGDIASASPLVIDTDGNYFDVTGTTNFAAMTVESGNFFMLQFDGALTITHGSGIELPGAANLTTAAGDRLVCYATAANTVEVMSVELETAASAGGFTLATPQASTSGTAIDFTGIPAGTKQIVIMFTEVSLSGTDRFRIQIGDSGGMETSAYWSGTFTSYSVSNTLTTNSDTGAFCFQRHTSGADQYGQIILSLANSTNHVWVGSGTLNDEHNAGISFMSGWKDLSAELTQVRITREGSNTFDAGEINIMYQ